MKYVVIALLLTGCTSLGDVEGLGRTGEVLRTIDSACKRSTGHSCDESKVNAPQINKTVGELKQFGYYTRNRSIPHMLQEINHVLTNFHDGP